MSASSRTLTLFSTAALLGPCFLALWAPQAIAETGNAASQAQQGEQIAEQHEEAVPASKLQLEAVASYLNQLDD